MFTRRNFVAASLLASISTAFAEIPAPSDPLADQIVRYDFVRETNGWKIDDIKGSSDGEAWSIRKMLTDELKS